MSTTSARVAAPIMEVFASFQGEGLYVGQPQVFLRLAGCPLRCRWCDTPGSWAVRPDASARIDAVEGPQRESRLASPFQAALWVSSVEPGAARTVSVTGGEPLIWPDFIRSLRAMLAPRRIHLETAGAHPEALARVLDHVDHVSLDLKLPADMDAPVEIGALAVGTLNGAAAEDLPSVTTERAPTTADEWTLVRRRCLDLIADRDACVKIVVVAGHPSRAYEPLFEDVARRAPDLPVFIAPATAIADTEAPSLAHLIDVVEHARDLDLDVRVLPQVHRAMGIA